VAEWPTCQCPAAQDPHAAGIQIDDLLRFLTAQMALRVSIAIAAIRGIRQRIGRNRDAVGCALRKAMVAGHKDHCIGGKLSHHAAYILPHDLLDRGVIDKGQFLVIVVEVVIGKVKDDIVQTRRRVAYADA